MPQAHSDDMVIKVGDGQNEKSMIAIRNSCNSLRAASHLSLSYTEIICAGEATYATLYKVYLCIYFPRHT